MATKLDPEVLAHLEWLGFVQPTGLVVSAPALVRAGAILPSRDAEGQRLLRACVEERTVEGGPDPEPIVADFKLLASKVLGWSFSPRGYAGTDEAPIPPELEVTLPDYGETLAPDFAVRERDPADGASPWQLLVRELEVGEDLDRVTQAGGGLEASPHGRMERLLRETGVAAGLLSNGRVLRLISAPRGESSGWIDFSLGRDGPDGRQADSGRAPSPVERTAPARPPAGAALRGTARRQPALPERGQREARRTGSPRALRAAPGLPGRPRRHGR